MAVSDTQSAVDALTATIRDHLSGQDCVLLDWPNYSNIGDHLIWLGIRQILSDIDARVVYSSAYDDCDFSQIEQHSGAAILLTGGGNFGDLYPAHQAFRETIVRKFPERKILFLPQTIHYRQSSAFETTRKNLARANALTILVRDHRSLEFLRSAAPELDSRLAIDSAFALEPVLQHVVTVLEFQQHRPVFVLRRDQERKSKRRTPRTAVKIDWCDAASMDAYQVLDLDGTLKRTGLSALVEDWRDRRSAEYLLQSLQLLGGSSFVVTDRLHCHILCRMLGKKHIFFDNTYGKNTEFVRAFGCGDAASRWPELELAAFRITSPFLSGGLRSTI